MVRTASGVLVRRRHPSPPVPTPNPVPARAGQPPPQTEVQPKKKKKKAAEPGFLSRMAASKPEVARATAKGTERPRDRSTSPAAAEAPQTVSPPKPVPTHWHCPEGGGLLHPLMQELDPATAAARIATLAGCGIFTREQLLYALTTRATKGINLPFEAYFRGRPFLVNELIATCSGGVEHTLDIATADALLKVLPTSTQRGAPVAAGSQGEPEAEVVEPTLSAAVIRQQRLDVRAALSRIGVTTSAAFVRETSEITAGGIGSAAFMRAPLNDQLKTAGEKTLGEDVILGIRERCEQPAQPAGVAVPRKQRGARGGEGAKSALPVPGCVLRGAQGIQWGQVSKEATGLFAGGSKQEEPADVVYVEGDMPLVIGVPYGGLKGGRFGSGTSAKE
jgi:hypothetical protein